MRITNPVWIFFNNPQAKEFFFFFFWIILKMKVILNGKQQFSMMITLQVHPRLAQQDPDGEAPKEHHGGGGQRLQG
jgi:hypothetical protein